MTANPVEEVMDVVDDVDVLEVEDPDLVREVAQEIASAPSQQELVIDKVVESHVTGPVKFNMEEVSRREDRHDRSRSRGLRHEEDQREHRRQWRRGESWESFGGEKRSHHDRSESRSAHDRNQKGHFVEDRGYGRYSDRRGRNKYDGRRDYEAKSRNPEEQRNAIRR